MYLLVCGDVWQCLYACVGGCVGVPGVPGVGVLVRVCEYMHACMHVCGCMEK